MMRWVTGLTYEIERRAAHTGRIYKLAALYYRDVIEKEATLAGITARDKILCIGGGLCPFSAILFHQVTGACVTVIDNNAACIPKARQAISRLGLDNYVKVACVDGTEIDFDGYSVVHIALQVTPVEQVFCRAARFAAAGTKILVRRPRKTVGALYGGGFLPSSCPYVAHTGTRNIGSTLMYMN